MQLYYTVQLRKIYGGNEKMVILKIFKILFDYTHTACLFKKQTYLFCLLCWTPNLVWLCHFLSLGDQRDYQIMSLDKFLVGFFFIFFHNFHLKNILKLSWKGKKRQNLKSVLQSSELLKQSDSNLHSHLYSEAGYLNSDSFSGFVRWNRFFLDLKMEKMTLVLNSRYSNT